MIDDRILRVIELTKQYCPGWEIMPEEEGGLKGVRSFGDYTTTVRLLHIAQDENHNNFARALIYDSREGDDPIFRSRLNISDSTEIMEKFRKWKLDVAPDPDRVVKEIPKEVKSLIEHSDHALHTQAFEGSQIYLPTLTEFIKQLPERKPPLIVGFADQGDVIMFYGPTGHGITSLMLNIAAHLMFGRDFLGLKIPRPVPNIGYLHTEGSARVMEEKAKRLAKLFPGFPDKLFYIREGRFKITDPDGEATLRNIATNRNLEACFIDNLINFIAGINVNDPNEVSNFVMNRISNVAVVTGCTFFFAWHTGQPTLSRRTGNLFHPLTPMSSIEFAGHSDLTCRYAKDPSREGPRIWQVTEDDKRRSTDKLLFRMEAQQNPLTELITLADSEEEVTPAPYLGKEDIKALREKRGWTQNQLADEIGTTVREIRRWEKGEAEPGDEFRRKLWALQSQDMAEDI